ncbi:tape measure chaperone [Serratia phage Scapp]|uniref:Tape measure chaperone n=1 Tax=Serratia phage Scapp TaxID=2282409 RepID=A0A345L6Q6_9CAUD|nr:tape measure chaperone [Serratia phage Scapp]AXH50958.1 tape measure chaperone [Serratia phage Scapp]
MPAAFSIDQRSTFILPVEFHRPGNADPVTVRFTCAHKKLSEVSALEKEMRTSFDKYFADEAAGKVHEMTFVEFKVHAEAKFVAQIAQAWDAASDFTQANLAEMFDAYPSAYTAFAAEYSAELMGTREKY